MMDKRYFLTLGLFLALACEKPRNQTPPLPPVYVTKPIVQDMPIYFDYVGHVDAYSTVQVQSQVSGILVEQKFVQGQNVKKGDMLFIIDPRPYEADLKRAEASLAQNIATLKLSEDTVRRYRKLIQEDYVSQLTFDQYVTNVAVDEAIIKQNLADIDLAKINLGYCYISSPINARTGVLNIYPGNFITVGESTPLITLNQISPIFLNFYVPERQFQTIMAKQNGGSLKATAFVNEDYSKPYDGTVTLIDNQVDQSTGMFLIQATLPNEDEVLWPGQFVTSRLYLETQKNAVLVPVKSIEYGQNGPYVFVVKEDMTIDMRSVELGQFEGELVIINKGIGPGETVVTDGQINLRPGIKVSIKEAVK